MYLQAFKISPFNSTSKVGQIAAGSSISTIHLHSNVYFQMWISQNDTCVS